MQILKDKFIASLTFILLWCLYIYCTPYTVQSGDTGELVTNSYFLRVSHPPGYPLWTLLYHIPLKYISFGNPFAAASIFNSFIGLCSLLILYVSWPSRVTLLMTLILGSASVVWKYFLLPDVFALHCLFVSLIYLVFVKPELLNKWWIIFLISLSIAHHHTIVFCFPLFMFSLFRSRLTTKKVWISLLSGIVSLGLYFLLLYFNPEDYGSWGNLKSVKDVVHHFLRKEYGTLSLARPSADSHSWTIFFFKTILKDYWSFFVFLLYLVIAGRKHFWEYIKSSFALIFCLIFYLVVFELNAQVSFDLIGGVVFERFLIMPIFLITFLLIHLARNSLHSIPTWIYFSLALNLVINLWSNLNHLNFKEKTGIHDLVINSFNQLPKKSILYANGDTFGFSSYYLQEVQNLRKDLILLHPNWEFPWSSRKAQKKYPEIFNAGNDSKFVLTKIKENEVVFSNRIFEILPMSISIGYVGILFKYSFKNEKLNKFLDCRESYNFLKRPSLKDFAYFDEGSNFSFTYGGCHFQEGLEYLKTNKFELAKNSFKTATILSPYNSKFLERLCYVLNLLKSSEYQACDKHLDFLIENTNSQYYLSK